MTECGILFSAPMMRALFAGTKTQTRRVCKPAEAAGLSRVVPCGAGEFGNEGGDVRFASPYGGPGGRLWVRETFYAYGRWETRPNEKTGRDAWRFIDMTVESGHAWRYAVDGPDLPLVAGRSATPGWHTRTALFMPRAASRVLLEIVSVRVERLQDIGEEDGRAEGVTIEDRHVHGEAAGKALPPSVRAYRELWEQINGPGGWKANPWVWVVEFGTIGRRKTG